MLYAIVILGAYLLGCSNMAMYLAKRKQVDLAGGSGNPGTSNAVILMGWNAGILVGLHDIGKGVLAVVLAELIFPQLAYIGPLAGVACVLGHIFPVFMSFRGGKGFASYLGMTLALNWKLALILIVAVAALTLLTDYIVAGTVTTVVTVPAVQGFLTGSWLLAGILSLATGVILYKHRENFVRIWKGTELGFRGVAGGKHRADKQKTRQ